MGAVVAVVVAFTQLKLTVEMSPMKSRSSSTEVPDDSQKRAALPGEDPTTDLDQGANPGGGRALGPEGADGVTDQGADRGGEADQARGTGFALVTSMRIVARKTWSESSLSTAL